MKRAALILALAGAAAAPARAQSRFLLTDRTNHIIFATDDLNASGFIDEPGELSTFFSVANAAGVPSIGTTTALAVRPDGLTALGSLTLGVVLIHDLNKDGDGQDIGESYVAAGPGNASGIGLGFVSGLAFDPAGTLYACNAGNSNGNDAIYRLIDLDTDGRFMSAGEVQPFVADPAFGPGNGPYSPQEIVLMGTPLGTVGFVHNSSTGLFGVYRFADNNLNGRADDPGEFTVYWDATNASGISPVAGLPLVADAARPGSLYLHQVATGGVDQIVRLTDVNGDGDAQDAGEAVLVYSNAVTGFTVAGIASLADGRVLLTDASGRKVFILTDADNDGLFSAAESAVYFANSGGLAADCRQIAAIARPCQANCDSSTTAPILNVNDFACFLNAFAAGNFYANCDSSTAPPILNVNDFACFLNKFAAGCP